LLKPSPRREWEATPMIRFVEPQEVAAVMLFLCSVDASAMTGQAINVTGGFVMTRDRLRPSAALTSFSRKGRQ
jgi:NAD(P)-dependent dehydrogenase (short-subunit alcohol dehydrogenase family)